MEFRLDVERRLRAGRRVRRADANRSAEVTRILAPRRPACCRWPAASPTRDVPIRRRSPTSSSRLLATSPGPCCSTRPARASRLPLVPRRPPGAAAGPPAEIEELIVTSGGIESMALLCQSLVDGRRRGRGADVPRRADGVRRLQAEMPSPMDERHAGRRARRSLRRRARRSSSTSSPTTRTRPAGRSASRRGGADRHVPAHGVADPGGRGATARWRSTARRCRRSCVARRRHHGPGRHLLEDLRPGVRLGWAVGPRDVIAQMARREADHRPVLERLLPAHPRELRPRRRVRGADPAQPRACTRPTGGRVEQALRRYLPDGCTWSEPAGGFFAWLTLPPQLDADEMPTTPWRRASRTCPVTPSTRRPRPQRVRLSFSHLSEDELDRAVERLAGVIRGSPRRPPDSPCVVRAVFLDVGETLVDETRDWQAWADHLGVPRMTWSACSAGSRPRRAPPHDLRAAGSRHRRRRRG